MMENINELVTPGECIDLEMMNFMNNFANSGLGTAPVLLFPPGLGPVFLKCVRYIAAMYNLTVIYVGDRRLRTVAVLRFNHLKKYYQDNCSTYFCYNYEDTEPVVAKHLHDELSVTLSSTVRRNIRRELGIPMGVGFPTQPEIIKAQMEMSKTEQCNKPRCFCGMLCPARRSKDTAPISLFNVRSATNTLKETSYVRDTVSEIRIVGDNLTAQPRDQSTNLSASPLLVNPKTLVQHEASLYTPMPESALLSDVMRQSVMRPSPINMQGYSPSINTGAYSLSMNMQNLNMVDNSPNCILYPTVHQSGSPSQPNVGWPRSNSYSTINGLNHQSEASIKMTDFNTYQINGLLNTSVGIPSEVTMLEEAATLKEVDILNPNAKEFLPSTSKTLDNNEIITEDTCSPFKKSKFLNANAKNFLPVTNSHKGSLSSTEKQDFSVSTFSGTVFDVASEGAQAIKCVPNKPYSIDSENVLEEWKNCITINPLYKIRIFEYIGSNALIALASENYVPYTKNLSYKMEHVIELYGFPETFISNTLLTVYNKPPRHLKWCDTTHALLVTGSPEEAIKALKVKHRVIKSRPFKEASPISVIVAYHCHLPPATSQTNYNRRRNKYFNKRGR